MRTKRRLASLMAVILSVFVIAGTATLCEGASKGTAITKVRLTIDAPESGRYPADTAELPSTAHSTVKKVEWSGKLDADGTFMYRTTYKVTVTLGIKKDANYYFSSKSINATVNGKEADEVLWYADDEITVTYTFPQFGTGDILTMARITLEAPAVGARPADTAHMPSTASTYIKNLTWSGPLDANGCFQAGTEYTATITLGVKDGLNRKFSDKTFDATVNGEIIDAATLTRVSDKEMIVPVEFTRLAGGAPQTEVKTLEKAVLTIAAPVAGETPAASAEIVSGEGCFVKNVTWSGALEDGKFQGGVAYTAVITLGIEDGANVKFSNDFFDAIVNDVIVDDEMTRVSDKELIIPVGFDKTPMPEETVPEPVKTIFTDVPGSSPYASAIVWAVEKGVTNGTSATTFTPDGTCSQAQILTFLWRAKGSPMPQGTMELTGIDAGQYYYQASLWAAEQGMLAEGDYYPDSPCTRAMAVTYLWKQAGSPAAPSASFADVPDGAGYARAVAWAVANGVTNGTGPAAFSPDATCTRGQIATFLYRAFAS